MKKIPFFISQLVFNIILLTICMAVAKYFAKYANIDPKSGYLLSGMFMMFFLIGYITPPLEKFFTEEKLRSDRF